VPILIRRVAFIARLAAAMAPFSSTGEIELPAVAPFDD